MASRRAAVVLSASLFSMAALSAGFAECSKDRSMETCATRMWAAVLLPWRRPNLGGARPSIAESAPSTRVLSEDGHEPADSEQVLPCKVETSCPRDWLTSSPGGYFCPAHGGCRPEALGPFPDCQGQCSLGVATASTTASASTPAFAPAPSGGAPPCEGDVPCPADWRTGAGGYFCLTHRGCQPAAQGPFTDCQAQCWVGIGAAPSSSAPPSFTGTSTPPSAAPMELPPCPDSVPCPPDWRTGSSGGYFCVTNGGCRAGDQGGFPDCEAQCYIGNALRKPTVSRPPPLRTQILKEAGHYNLRAYKSDRLVGCAAPVGLFAGNEKYGCGGRFGTAQTCDAAKFPIKDTKYVAAVHAGCLTAEGKGTYAYAYDDGVGLKQCAPATKYEWILCPDGNETGVAWDPEAGSLPDSLKRFRVTNKCKEPVWIQMVPALEPIHKLEVNGTYAYSIPNKGLPSMRYLPKTGCDASGNACDVQSMPPCPPQGCDALAIETKFEASWGCRYATGGAADRQLCTLTAQGNPSTYQDWWDGSAVDGWTLPFSVLVEDDGFGLSPFDKSSQGSTQCQDVICANLSVQALCPMDEFLTPEA